MHFLPMINSHCCVFQDGEKEKEIKYIEMARTNKVDGIIGVTFSDVEEYLDDTLAFVSIERRFRKIFRVYPEIIIWADVWRGRESGSARCDEPVACADHYVSGQ